MGDAQVIAFTVAVAILTVAPGADNMLVIRNVLRGGRHPAGGSVAVKWCVAILAYCQSLGADRKSTRLNSSHLKLSRMPSSA